MADLATLDLIGHAALVRSGEATALELLDAAIARIESARMLNAVICELFDRARSQASDPLGDGPLAGAPFLLKDLGASMAGVPERMGSVALRDHESKATSVVVARYLAAGLVVAGKTNTPEWGNHCTTEPVLFGPTINPRAPDRSPGGSSGGSAVAVAAGLVPAASGGDGTGSIRVPASCCGVIGLKPARGRKTFAPDAGHQLEGLVRCSTRSRCWTRSPSCTRSRTSSLHALAESALGRPPEPAELESTAWEMLEEGRSVTDAQYAGAIATVHAQGRRFANGLADVDMLLVPTLLTGGPPPLAHLNQPRGSTREFFRVEFATTGWTPMANVSGFAAISLPLATTTDGLPIGVHLMAHEETVLLQLAAQLERAYALTT